jgi:formate dehydrogenase iron-sulfur subunit
MIEIQHKAFLFDATRCIDCRACMVACSAENHIDMNKTRIWVSGVGVKGEFPELTRATMVYHCMHCEVQACASACPVGAHSRRPDGVTTYDHTRCIGCRSCMNACPYGVPHFDHDKGLLDGAFIDKCTFCTQRVDKGLEPACVATCPTNALVYGERADLLKEAHARIANHPGRYIDHVYGETENGGTAYLILSHVPFSDLGLPDLSPVPVANVSEALAKLTVPSSLVLGAVLTAATVFVDRRNKVKKAEQAAPDETQEHEDKAA